MPAAADSAATGAPRVGYLGPPGTFSEQALLTQADLAAGVLVELPSITDVIEATANGDVDFGVVPLENAIEGAVNVTLDTLAFDADLLLQREIVIAVQMNLLGLTGATLPAIRQVLTIPVATAQCRSFLRKELAHAAVLPASSTAEAAQQVVAGGDPSVAAIGTELAARLYGLEVLARDIEDHPENETRFGVVARGSIPAPTGHDKTSIVVFQKADEPVADCLRDLKSKQADVKFLGSYPATGEHGERVRRDADAAWRQADAWVRDLRGRIGSR